MNVAAKPNPRLQEGRRPEELAREVLLRAQRQESEACRQLFRRYQQPVHALLYRMVASSHGVAVVDELSQETFLRVFRKLHTFDPERGSRLSSWILTIATRLALKIRRRRQHEPLIGEVTGPSAVSPAQRALAACVASAVMALPPKQRAAFLLREYHGLDYGEIADALKTSIGTVKSRLSRARTQLRQTLAEYES